MRAVAPQLRFDRAALELLLSLKPLRTRKQTDVGSCPQTASSFMSAETGTKGIDELT